MAEELRQASIPVEDWMSQQTVECWDICGACCRTETAKRRKGRCVLFKRLALQEIDRRYNMYENIMLPEEKEAVQQVKKKFMNGLYRSIFAFDYVGTFYLPFSPIFHLLPYAYMLLFPATQVLARLFCQRVCGKDQIRVCFWLPLFIYIICFWPFLLIGELVIMFLFYPLILIFELLLMLCSFLCYFGVYCLKNKGVFKYSFKVTLILAMASASRATGVDSANIVTLTLSDVASSVSIDHYPFRRVVRPHPITKIFKDMDMDTYNFGDIDGLEVTDQDIEQYEKLYQIQASLQQEVNQMI